MEIWKPIKNFNKYQISNFGRVKSLIGKEKILKPVYDTKGYLSVKLNGKRFLIHRLVANEFLENPNNKLEVNHKNKLRDDNNIKNLEWVTREENVLHQFNKPDWEKFSKSIKKQIKELVLFL